jgi:hypothetical protein
VLSVGLIGCNLCGGCHLKDSQNEKRRRGDALIRRFSKDLEAQRLPGNQYTAWLQAIPRKLMN